MLQYRDYLGRRYIRNLNSIRNSRHRQARLESMNSRLLIGSSIHRCQLE
jgi:hypothetical protein